MKHCMILIAISLMALAGCKDDDVKPDNEVLFESCLVYVDGEFQDVPLDTDPAYIYGGEDSFNSHLVMRINYPPEAREDNIQGLTLTSFEISESGVLENIQDAGSDFEILSDATIAGLSTFEGQPIFEPAELDSETVRVQKTVRVRYTLE